MKKLATYTLVLLALCCTNANAFETHASFFPFDPEIPAGGGRFDGENGNYTDIRETENGHIIEMFLAEQGTQTREDRGEAGPSFYLTFTPDPGQWLEFRIVRADVEPAGMTFPSYGAGAFYGDDFHFPSTSQILEPNPKSRYAWSKMIDNSTCLACRPLRQTIEYSLVETEPPLPGDFNFDGKVAFDDFLVIANNYQAPVIHSWVNGDANFDKVVDVEDFVILADNFGRTRVADGDLAAVPEPSFHPVFLFVLSPVLFRRKRRGRSPTSSTRPL